MRAGIDATSWSNLRGYGRFTRSLLGALFSRPRAHELTLFIDEPSAASAVLPAGAPVIVVPTRRAPSEAASASGSRSPADLLAMSRAVSRAKLDAMIFPTVYTYFPVFSRAKVVVGIHDTIAEDHAATVFPEWRARTFWRMKSALARWQADRLFTVSEHARARVAARFGVAAANVALVGEAPGPEFRRLEPHEIDDALLARYGLTRSSRFVVYVGGINPHKNLARLADAFDAVRRGASDVAEVNGRLARSGTATGAELSTGGAGAFADLQLVIVGEIEKELFTPGVASLRDHVGKLPSAESIRFTGFLPDADVVTLLNSARALVLPSLAEGYGLPAVEAAACGTPVIATTESPLPQLLAGGGLFVDPHSTAEIADALRRLCGDESLRVRLGEGALAAARKLSWEASAQQLMAILDSLEQTR